MSFIAGRYDSLTISVELCAKSIVRSFGFVDDVEDVRFFGERTTTSSPLMTIRSTIISSIEPHVRYVLRAHNLLHNIEVIRLNLKPVSNELF